METIIETTYHIITPSARSTRTVDWPRKPDLGLLQGLIKPIVGGHMEHVTVYFNNQYTDMFVNEEGRIFGFPLNKEATEIYLANWRRQNPGKEDPEGSFIVGNAVVFERRIWF